MSKLLDEVVSELSRLPGIGRRTAMRLAMHLLRMEPRDVELMSESISRFRTDIRYCSRCNNLSDDDLCEICADTSRDASTVCVVEQVKDLLSIENTRQYNGLYHVLGGVISPMQGIGPSDLKIDLLLDGIGHRTVGRVDRELARDVQRGARCLDSLRVGTHGSRGRRSGDDSFHSSVCDEFGFRKFRVKPCRYVPAL